MVPSCSSLSCPSVGRSPYCPSQQLFSSGALHSAPTFPPQTSGGAGSSPLLLPGDHQSLGNHSAPLPSNLLPPSLGTPGVPLGAPLQTQSSVRRESHPLTPQQPPGFYVPLVLQPPPQASCPSRPLSPATWLQWWFLQIVSQREVRLVLQDSTLGSCPEPHPSWARPPAFLFSPLSSRFHTTSEWFNALSCPPAPTPIFHTRSKELSPSSHPASGRAPKHYECDPPVLPRRQASRGPRLHWLPGRQVHSRRRKRRRDAMGLGALALPLPQRGSGLSFVLGTMSHHHCLVCGWGKEGDAARDASLSLPGAGGEPPSRGAAPLSVQGLPRPRDHLHAQVTMPR